MHRIARNRRNLLIGLVASVVLGYWLSRSSSPSIAQSSQSTATRRHSSNSEASEKRKRRLVNDISSKASQQDELDEDQRNQPVADIRSSRPDIQRYVRRRKTAETRTAERKPQEQAVIPAPYRQRLELLKEEREVAMLRSARETEPTRPAEMPHPLENPEPIDVVVVAKGESRDRRVQPALAEFSEAESVRDVAFASHESSGHPLQASHGARGAWLAGVIETE